MFLLPLLYRKYVLHFNIHNSHLISTNNVFQEMLHIEKDSGAAELYHSIFHSFIVKMIHLPCTPHFILTLLWEDLVLITFSSATSPACNIAPFSILLHLIHWQWIFQLLTPDGVSSCVTQLNPSANYNFDSYLGIPMQWINIKNDVSNWYDAFALKTCFFLV